MDGLVELVVRLALEDRMDFYVCSSRGYKVK